MHSHEGDDEQPVLINTNPLVNYIFLFFNDIMILFVHLDPAKIIWFQQPQSRSGS
jgi:hypothetical protein